MPDCFHRCKLVSSIGVSRPSRPGNKRLLLGKQSFKNHRSSAGMFPKEPFANDQAHRCKWSVAEFASCGAPCYLRFFPWQCLYFLLLPQGHGIFLPTFGTDIGGVSASTGRTDILSIVICCSGNR